jgi:hypothetical protein
VPMWSSTQFDQVDPPGSSVYERATGAALRNPRSNIDDLSLLAWSRDARFVWAGGDPTGAVYDVESGVPQVELDLPDHEWPDASLIDPSMLIVPNAFGLTPEATWRFVHYDGTLSDGHDVLASLGEDVHAAAFSPSGALALARASGEIVVVDGTTGAVRLRGTL